MFAHPWHSFWLTFLPWMLFGLQLLSHDFHQRIQQNWDGSKMATPKRSLSMGKQCWDKNGRAKLSKQNPIFRAVDIIKFGNLLAGQDAEEGHSETETLPGPPVSDGTDSSGSLWTGDPRLGFCPVKCVPSQHLRALQGNIQLYKIRMSIKCFSNWTSSLLSHKPGVPGP